ncbi:MAG: sugar transferase [Siculibacillus sp.]
MVAVDAGLIVASTILAHLFRMNFEATLSQVEAISTYAAVTAVVAVPITVFFGLDRSIWRLTSMVDYIAVANAVVATVIAATIVDFFVDRLNDVPRSLPFLQAILAIGVLVGSRVLVRMIHRRRRSRRRPVDGMPASVAATHETVLIVGLDRLADLFVTSVAELGEGRVEIVGIVGETRRHTGRTLSKLRILGSIEEIAPVLRDLEIHGVFVDRIVVTIPYKRLPEVTRLTLSEIEESTRIRVDYFTDWLFSRPPRRSSPADARPPAPSAPLAVDLAAVRDRPFWRIKRLIDTIAAAVLVVTLAPIMLLVAFLVAVDVGLPVTFWQRRPGRDGRPFRLFKFRTMRAAHDRDGRRLADEERTSRIGALMRKTRLDELPQLFHILLGEMSFIGPRPLLPIDQPEDATVRLLVRPGLTGWAQVQGGRAVSPEEKSVLDEWYVRNASFRLDLEIVLRTIPMVLIGERYNTDEIARARDELERAAEAPDAHA